MKRQANRWSEGHAKTIRKGLENHVLPYLGDCFIADLGTKEMLNVLHQLEAEGKHEAAHRARQRCEAVFRYGIITGICERNPASDLMRSVDCS